MYDPGDTGDCGGGTFCGVSNAVTGFVVGSPGSLIGERFSWAYYHRKKEGRVKDKYVACRVFLGGSRLLAWVLIYLLT